MNLFDPTQDLEVVAGKLMENLGQQLLPLCDMSDQKTAENYWIFMRMQGSSIAAQLQAAFALSMLKRKAVEPSQVAPV